jgi:superfamily I DNA and/or RNA helicase
VVVNLFARSQYLAIQCSGDHKQLPPTIKCSAREVQNGLGMTLFERLMLAFDTVEGGETSCRSKMLEVQYRMHQNISDWASSAMYKGKLISHESVRDRELATLPMVIEHMRANCHRKSDNIPLENTTLILIDTTGCGMHEIANEAGSRYNEGEANIVVSHVQSLLSIGLKAEDIAVITPYKYVSIVVLLYVREGAKHLTSSSSRPLL